MTSLNNLSVSSILGVLTLAIVLLGHCPEASRTINQSYNASAAEGGSSTTPRLSSPKGPEKVTANSVLGTTNPLSVGVTETKLYKEKGGVAGKMTSTVNSQRSVEETSDSTTPVVLKCGVSCTCYELDKLVYEEYRVICNNTKQEAVILSSDVFQPDGMPTWNKQTYVQVQGVTSIMVTKGFVARWTAYNSCAMDFWDAGDVILPPGPTEKAESEAFLHAFAGLGIKNSRLAQIPHGVFADIDKYGLDLENVSIPILNLHNLVYPPSKTLRYLRLTNVVVGTIQGKMVEEAEEDLASDYEGGSDLYSINLGQGSSYQKKKAGIWINNTQIGVIEANGLNLVSGMDMTVSLDNSEMGMIKTDGLKLKGQIIPQIQNSRVALEEGSIVLGEGMTMKATHNQIVLPENIFNKWNCEQNTIEGNDFIVLKLPESVDGNRVVKESQRETFQEAKSIKTTKDVAGSTPQQSTTQTVGSILPTIDDTERPMKKPSELDAFIHPTCVGHNRILNVLLKAPTEVQDDLPTEPSNVIDSPAEDSSNNPTVEAETVHPINSSDESQRFSISSNSMSEKHFQIHKGLAFLTLAAIGALLLIVLVLVGILVFRRKRASRDIYQEAPARDRRPSLMYMPGSSVYGNDTWPMPSVQTLD